METSPEYSNIYGGVVENATALAMGWVAMDTGRESNACRGRAPRMKLLFDQSIMHQGKSKVMTSQQLIDIKVVVSYIYIHSNTAGLRQSKVSHAEQRNVQSQGDI